MTISTSQHKMWWIMLAISTGDIFLFMVWCLGFSLKRIHFLVLYIALNFLPCKPFTNSHNSLSLSLSLTKKKSPFLFLCRSFDFFFFLFLFSTQIQPFMALCLVIGITYFDQIKLKSNLIMSWARTVEHI